MAVTQYFKSKPAKYGLQVFELSDAKIVNPLQGSIYKGREAGMRGGFELRRATCIIV